MSMEDNTIAILSQLSSYSDVILSSLGLSYIGIKLWSRFKSTSSTLHQIHRAKSFQISDLCSLVSELESDSSEGELVVVRGHIASSNKWWNLGTNVLKAENSGEKGVVLHQTNGCFIYGDNESWASWLPWRYEKYTTITTVPFGLVENGQNGNSGYVFINMGKSSHQLPLKTIYRKLPTVHSKPVGLLEEKILPLGKEISAIGICSAQNGKPEISSCNELSYFLTEKTKAEIMRDLKYNKNTLLCGLACVGVLSVGMIVFAIRRNRRKWKAWRQAKKIQELRIKAIEEDDKEEEDVSDQELCTICLVRRRRYAFVPCGHLICCRKCVATWGKKRCPLCRQEVKTNIRVENLL
ncbi:RING-type E3 ubiquitin transferase [Ranunculus cassubicifolius]